jgi:hypothetical protein
MTRFAVIETESGLAVTAVPVGATAEDAAAEQGGIIIDPGPFENYEDAYDAMLAIPDEEEDRESPQA